MNALKIAIAFTLLLAVNSLFCFAYKPLLKESPAGNLSRARLIAYTVMIHVSPGHALPGSHYMVTLSDGTGRQIAPPQTFRQGVSTYTFFEPGPVRGTRVARLVALPLGPHSYAIPPVSQTGLFLGNAGYLFNIFVNPDIAPADQLSH
jgi:hypothetical protein